jgi:hypothetical protein
MNGLRDGGRSVMTQCIHAHGVRSTLLDRVHAVRLHHRHRVLSLVVCDPHAALDTVPHGNQQPHVDTVGFVTHASQAILVVTFRCGHGIYFLKEVV